MLVKGKLLGMLRRAWGLMGRALERVSRSPDGLARQKARKALSKLARRSPERVASDKAKQAAWNKSWKDARTREQVAIWNAGRTAYELVRLARRSPEKVAIDNARRTELRKARRAARTPEQVVRERLLRKGYKKKRREIDKALRRAKLLP